MREAKPLESVSINSCFIDPALWSRFARAENREEFCRSWLALQCSYITGVIQGIVVLGDEDSGVYSPVSKWPEKGANPERLAGISEKVCQERCGLLEALEAVNNEVITTYNPYAVAYPILIENRLHGVVALETVADSEEQLKTVMTHLQWGVSWMELLFRRQQAQEDKASLARLKSAVDIMAGVLSEETHESACMSFATEMAMELSCDRVSVAFAHKNRARIQAVSHSAQMGKRMNLIRAVGLAMDEAIVQRKEIFFPPVPGQDVLIVRDHEQLAKQHGAGSILTLPFYGNQAYNGAMTLERPSWQPFTDEDARFCRSVASLLFPVLNIRRNEERSLIYKIWDAFKKEIIQLFGPRHPWKKLLIVTLVALIAFFTVKTGDYKITADTVLEGAVRRVVVAPFDGYIKAANVRAGDTVNPQTIMCILDDGELRLERLNWLSKRTQLQRQYQEALARHNRSDAKIIKAQLDQATAKLELAESQIKRTRIAAPFEGIIVSDNLRMRLGGAVGKGEVLFEVTPLDAYRIILEVDERRIADVKVGQRGSMLLSALPTEPISFIIDKITPITVAKEGLNYFRVEADPDTVSRHLRPGMEGVGKISVDQRNLFGIWTRDFREWFRLWLWSKWP